MGSSKKHKRDREVVRRHKKRSRSRSKTRSRSQSPERHDRKHYKKHHRERRHRKRSTEKQRDDYNSDSSDVIEVPVAPPAPVISSKRPRSPSPIPDGGAGDCLSIEETNKLRAKLGLKPLEVDSAPPAKERTYVDEKGDEPELKIHKDDYGEFVHKPASNFAETKQVEKIREKIKERKEKRQLENTMLKVKSLGASDEEDDLVSWVDKSREKERQKKEAESRAKWLEEMEEQIGGGSHADHEDREARPTYYGSRDLKGLRVEHDTSDFGEGKTIILTLKDQDVLNEDADTLVNVNLMDTERYRKNVENKKLNPQNYGYDCYADEVDEFGQPLSRAILKKYDDEIDGGQKKSFTLGRNLQEEQEHKRKILEIRCKLEHKRLETLNEQLIKPATDYYTEAEMAKFKKPKRKVKKSKRTLKADDLLPLPGEMEGTSRDMGSRRGQSSSTSMDIDDVPEEKVKIEPEDDDLEKMLSKARRLKQKESLIAKPIDTAQLKSEVKSEAVSDEEEDRFDLQSNQITLNATAEFCRTLGDIPTYGMAGNREGNTNDLIDFESEMNVEEKEEEPEDVRGTWNSVNASELEMEENSQPGPDDVGEIAILDEEPDVSAGVAGALRLAVSKGYLERDDKNRPSNTRMAHLQAKNYSIEDKTYAEDDKFGRRDRYHSGPSSDFKEKDGFKPNVKLEYIDDGGRVLNAKEAFRYLSHKFHGKGPGKNKIEKRLKKSEQEGLMMKMSSTDTPLGTLNMLQAKQRETNSPYIVLSGTKQNLSGSNIVKHKSK
ncbi:U4/U6.U5 tri-snRNP-associated protein 1 [Phlebotomus argentipes]|uniref:U4/U6.U5 tri-snRNP-associated protein 1 n=1 Tax=Phlebotomus argentipes TaxID=94469 RepID=UPI002892BA89|nr:U4/U6.U5 tri-snRNP-associated protein 1 [Phlebotomus argentipes]